MTKEDRVVNTILALYYVIHVVTSLLSVMIVIPFCSSKLLEQKKEKVVIFHNPVHYFLICSLFHLGNSLDNA